jgi:hypothetical protein
MLPSHAWPRSNTASFTEGWAREAPSENFLQDVVTRWRQQSFGSLNIDPDPAPMPVAPEPAPRPVAPQRQPAAAQAYMPPAGAPPVPAADLQGLGSRLRRTLPPLAPGEAPHAPVPLKADTAQPGAQPSLSTLMKQFRA